MASNVTGLTVIGDYTTGSPTNKATVARLRALLGDAGVSPGMANPAGTPKGAGFLDEMSPAANAQLIVELTALEAAIENV